jgi:hypothetical protein
MKHDLTHWKQSYEIARNVHLCCLNLASSDYHLFILQKIIPVRLEAYATEALTLQILP